MPFLPTRRTKIIDSSWCCQLQVRRDEPMCPKLWVWGALQAGVRRPPLSLSVPMPRRAPVHTTWGTDSVPKERGWVAVCPPGGLRDSESGRTQTMSTEWLLLCIKTYMNICPGEKMTKYIKGMGDSSFFFVLFYIFPVPYMCIITFIRKY